MENYKNVSRKHKKIKARLVMPHWDGFFKDQFLFQWNDQSSRIVISIKCQIKDQFGMSKKQIKLQ